MFRLGCPDRLRRRLGALRAPVGRPVALGSRGSGAQASLLLGLLAIALAWLGASWMGIEDTRRSEAAAYQETSNLARVFEENIIRLIQAHDQILLFARASYLAAGERF